MSETVFVTGVLGQDGAYLSRLALQQGYRVVGGTRKGSTRDTWRLQELGIDSDIEFVDIELSDRSNILECLKSIRPTRVFNLAAQSLVGASFKQPLTTTDIGALGVLRLLEAIRETDDGIKFYQASTAEMFGKVVAVPQSETTAFYPRSPYAVAKVFGHYITKNYREAYGLHASSGILFNHESPLRSSEFVTRKITSTLARISRGSNEVLELGNIDAERDWGHARDYVRGMWLMTERQSPDDYVLATGITTKVRRFLELAASACDMELEFSGEGMEEVAVDRKSGVTVMKINPAFYRPTEVDSLVGDSSKARSTLGWVPTVGLGDLVSEMVHADLLRL